MGVCVYIMEMIKFSERIKEYMRVYDLKQYEVAKRANVSGQAVSSWVVGRTTPIVGTMPELAKRLGVSLPWLMGFPTAPMIDEPEPDIATLIKHKLQDHATALSANTLNVKGSTIPVYTKEQLTLRMEMLSKALTLFEKGQMSEEALRLFVSSIN